jgi:hypothetical protein
VVRHTGLARAGPRACASALAAVGRFVRRHADRTVVLRACTYPTQHTCFTTRTLLHTHLGGLPRPFYFCGCQLAALPSFLLSTP